MSRFIIDIVTSFDTLDDSAKIDTANVMRSEDSDKIQALADFVYKCFYEGRSFNDVTGVLQGALLISFILRLL